MILFAMVVNDSRRSTPCASRQSKLLDGHIVVTEQRIKGAA